MALFAGLQQFMEGSVWLCMTGDDPFTVLWGAMGFIFFTWFTWPVWIPFSVYALEPNNSPRKRVSLIMSLIGLGFGLLATLHLVYIIQINKCARLPGAPWKSLNLGVAATNFWRLSSSKCDRTLPRDLRKSET
tara:strand:- start:15480 stop:15878 length:399 start_codon:yes stop_codon:yes gene_type:complete